MKYYAQNGVRIVEVPAKDFRIKMVDRAKKNIGEQNYCNAGFFQTFSEGKEFFTLPVGHLVADFAADCKWVERYCKSRGTVEGGKVTFDSGSWNYMNQFYGKAVSTLSVVGGRARINELSHLLSHSSYAIAGVPIMRNGQGVNYAAFVKKQGWLGSELYGTWHTFIGLKSETAETLYIMAVKTTSANMVSSGEAYKKLKPLGFRDVVKMDGGGSYYMNIEGAVSETSENRRINTIIEFGTVPAVTSLKANPYKMPTVALRKGSAATEGIKWLQWELNEHGYPCDVDGLFGPQTDKQLRQFQADHRLVVDGSCGPASRAMLLS